MHLEFRVSTFVTPQQLPKLVLWLIRMGVTFIFIEKGAGKKRSLFENKMNLVQPPQLNSGTSPWALSLLVQHAPALFAYPTP